jgi:5'-nucleotidase
MGRSRGQSVFLGGVEKREIVAALGADIFFDVQDLHCSPATREVLTAIVSYREEAARSEFIDEA